MRKIYLILAILCLVSCVGNQTSTKIDYNTLNSAEDIDKAIDQLVQPGNWTWDDCSTIDNKINSCRRYNVINDTQTKTLKQKLNSYSAKYLYEGVDALFRQSSYQGLQLWRDMLKNLQAQYDSFVSQGVELSVFNMTKAKDLIDAYDTVYAWANASGSAKAKFLEKYPYDISAAVTNYCNKVTSHANYQTYFKNNTDLHKSMDGMAKRMEASRVKYYDALEVLVEKHITERNLTEEQALDTQLAFNALEPSTSTHSEAAIRKLDEFVNNYIDTLLQDEI